MVFLSLEIQTEVTCDDSQQLILNGAECVFVFVCVCLLVVRVMSGTNENHICRS